MQILVVLLLLCELMGPRIQSFDVTDAQISIISNALIFYFNNDFHVFEDFLKIEVFENLLIHQTIICWFFFFLFFFFHLCNGNVHMILKLGERRLITFYQCIFFSKKLKHWEIYLWCSSQKVVKSWKFLIFDKVFKISKNILKNTNYFNLRKTF